MDSKPPFDTELLDRLMDEAGLDLLIMTSKHNVQYALGGHKAMFFDYMDAMGMSRYLPVLIYPRGAPDRTIYIGHRTETNQREVKPFWMASVRTASSGSVDAIELAVADILAAGLPHRRVGIEAAFLPFDAGNALSRLLPAAELVDALDVLERLRLRKAPRELAMVREATERVLGAMGEAFAACQPGRTKNDIVEVLRAAECARGLTFEYCLIAAGTSMNRAPSDQVLLEGDVVNLDSGGNYHGYIGDIARMGIVGTPDAELIELLGVIEGVQQAAFRAVQPGTPAGAIYDAAKAAMRATRFGNELHFLAHGMGLVSHEAPHLTTAGPVPYPDTDCALPLEPGVVLSIETTLRHSTRGFIKLEDTVAVTPAGHEIYGNGMRGWNLGGARAAAIL